ncbi:hypothetical protein [Aeromicrobium erythreum]|uniref:hypothetical protein n=1 Tax=Aeromicrobium erythreum TaxID=2041 RepID=UPI0011874ECA|nr:hypothetical protein [Aeromicrobium erythreum]
MAEVFRCTGMRSRSAIYVSAPITTGSRYIAWMNEGGDPSDYRRRVVEANIREAEATVQNSRSHFGAPLIDPTALPDVDGWTQPDYHAFWTHVVEEFVSTIVFVDGWEYSTGAVLELACGLQNRIGLLSSTYQELDPAAIEKKGREAITRVSSFSDFESLKAAWSSAFIALGSSSAHQQHPSRNYLQ